MLRSCVVAGFVFLSAAGDAVAQAPSAQVAQAVKTCLKFAGDIHDPRRQVIDEEIPPVSSLLDLYSYCDFAVRNAQPATPELMYTFAKLAWYLGNHRVAGQLSDRIWRGYPAAVGVMLNLRMQNPKWANENTADIEKAAEMARQGGYSRVDYDIAWSYEQLAKRLPSVRAKQLFYRAALPYFERAAADGDAQTLYRLANAKLMAWSLSNRQEPSYEEVTAAFAVAREKGSLGAAFVEDAMAAINAGEPTQAQLDKAIASFKAAFDAGVPEAVAMAVMSFEEFGVEYPGDAVGVRDLYNNEDDLFRLQRGLLSGGLQFNPVFGGWSRLTGDRSLEDLGLTPRSVLEAGFHAGFTPAGFVLLRDHVDASLLGTRQVITELSSFRTSGYRSTYRWIGEEVMTISEQAEMSDGMLNWAIGVLREQFSARDDASALHAAGLLKRAGRETDATDWFTGYLERSHQRNPKNSESYQDQRVQRMIQAMIAALYEHGFGFSEQLHKQGAQQNTEQYARAANEFLTDKIREHRGDLAQLEHWRGEAYRFAALGAEFQKVLSKEALVEFDDAILRAKPACKVGTQLGGGLYLVADEDSYQVGITDSYFYAKTAASSGDLFVMDLWYTYDGNDPTGFRVNDGDWIKRPGQNVDVRFFQSVSGAFGIGVYYAYPWKVFAPADQALARAKRGGSSVLTYTVKPNQQATQTFDFSGFPAALEQAREWHLQVKKLFEEKECHSED